MLWDGGGSKKREDAKVLQVVHVQARQVWTRLIFSFVLVPPPLPLRAQHVYTRFLLLHDNFVSSLSVVANDGSLHSLSYTPTISSLNDFQQQQATDVPNNLTCKHI